MVILISASTWKDGLFSSKTPGYPTPDALFNELNQTHKFTLDPCATEKNAKCELFSTQEMDGLSQSWGGHSIFMNPPYGREIIHWVQKAYYSTRNPNTSAVCLLPSRTDTKWFHEYVLKSDKIEFIRGRLKFGGPKTPHLFHQC